MRERLDADKMAELRVMVAQILEVPTSHPWELE